MYEVQFFRTMSEGNISKEMCKRAEQGWRVASTASWDKIFVVTWVKI